MHLHTYHPWDLGTFLYLNKCIHSVGDVPQSRAAGIRQPFAMIPTVEQDGLPVRRSRYGQSVKIVQVLRNSCRLEILVHTQKLPFGLAILGRHIPEILAWAPRGVQLRRSVDEYM